jgi:hypothetical protein
MQKVYGITRQKKQFLYDGTLYDTLDDAVAAARLAKANSA